MIKTVLKRWLTRAFVTILIIAGIVTIIKSSWLHHLVDRWYLPCLPGYGGTLCSAALA